MALVFISTTAVPVHFRSFEKEVIQEMENNGLLEKCYGMSWVHAVVLLKCDSIVVNIVLLSLVIDAGKFCCMTDFLQT
jgi:hypothetical protein